MSSQLCTGHSVKLKKIWWIPGTIEHVSEGHSDLPSFTCNKKIHAFVDFCFSLFYIPKKTWTTSIKTWILLNYIWFDTSFFKFYIILVIRLIKFSTEASVSQLSATSIWHLMVVGLIPTRGKGLFNIFISMLPI